MQAKTRAGSFLSSIRVMIRKRYGSGPIFRAIYQAGRIADGGFSPKVIWGVVKNACAECGLTTVARHDLRRTFTRLCHDAEEELDQIQFLLGPVSVKTTE
jgi:integrase